MPRRRTNTSNNLPTQRSATGAAGLGAGGGGSAGVFASDTYWLRSMRPLHVLVFLLPLLAAYEVGSILYLADPQIGVRRTVDALQVMRDFFDLLGVAGSLVPGIAMGVVLMVWHVMRRDPWTIDARTLGGMLAESAAWTLPLLVLSATVQHAAGTLSGWTEPVDQLRPLVQESTRRLLEQPVATRLTIAIGAGLYEEMLFRLIGIAVLHFIFADLIALPPRWSNAGAVILSALAFAAYHHPAAAADWANLILSGIYLGTVYLMRGFGIVVGTHALFDILVLGVQPAISG